MEQSNWTTTQLYTCNEDAVNSIQLWVIIKKKSSIIKKQRFDFVFYCHHSKRLNRVNHARRLANGDWTGADSDGEEEVVEDMEKRSEGERKEDGNTEEEEMEVERRKPRHYANQVRVSSHVQNTRQCWGLKWVWGSESNMKNMGIYE